MLKPVLHAVQLFLKGATGKDRQAKHHLSEHLLRMQLAYDQLQVDHSTLEQNYSHLKQKQTELTARLNRNKTDTDELLNIADSEVKSLVIANEDLQLRLRQSETEKATLQEKNGSFLGKIAFLEQQLDLRAYQHNSADPAPRADGEKPCLNLERGPEQTLDQSLPTYDQSIDLSNLSIALVGGHETTYREVTEVLKQYGLKRCIHVPPHSIASNSRNQIKDKISNCDLVVTITSYVDHSVAKCVKQLKDAQMLAGGSIRVSCHGKSGLVREVLEYFDASIQTSRAALTSSRPFTGERSMPGTSSDRLDRIEAVLESITKRLDSTAAQQAKNTEDIDTLLGAVSTNEVACRELRISVMENQDRFTVLREEARADRAETRRLFDDAITQMESNRAETRRLSDDAITQMESNRAETRRLSDDAITQMESNRAETRRLFDDAIAQIESNRAEARTHFEQLQHEAAEDRRRADERYAAQMEVTQTLLLELTKTNRSVTDLRDRVDLVEQSAG